MIPAEFDYAAPSSLEEALDLLDKHGEDAKVLAGGHSLIPVMKLRLAAPGMLIDLRHLSELRGIIPNRGGGVSIKAMTTHAEIARDGIVASITPALSQAAREIGDRQVRARGTIGGSLAHNDPAADLPAVMLALEAKMVLRSRSGERTVPADEFFAGMLETVLQPNELLTEVIIVDEAARSAYVKYANPASHYAIAGVAVKVSGNGTVESASIGVTGAAPVAYRATAAEAALAGKALSPESIAAAAEAAYDGRDLLSDIHASAEYRSALVKVLTRRALEKV